MQRLSPSRGDDRRDAAVRRVGGDRPVQLPVGARRRARPARRSSPATPSSQAVARSARSAGLKVLELLRRGRRARRRAQRPDRARRDRSAPRSSPTPASTASRSPARSRSAWRSTALRVGVPEAGDLRDGRQEPGHRQRAADLEAAVEGTARSAFGLAGQKCSAASRVFVDERGRRRVRRPRSWSGPRRSSSATRLGTEALRRPGGRRRRPSSATSARSREARDTGEVLARRRTRHRRRARARQLRRARPSSASRTTRGSGRRSCSCPLIAVRRVSRRSTRRSSGPTRRRSG